MYEALTTGKLKSFLLNAKPGEAAIYHEGFLGLDRWKTVGDRRLPRLPLHDVAKMAMEASDAGFAHLTQVKMGRGRWVYMATKAKRRTT